jgi:hypothetical protein
MLRPFSLFASLRWLSRKVNSLAVSKLTNGKFVSFMTLTAVCRSLKAFGKLVTVNPELEDPALRLDTATLIEFLVKIHTESRIRELALLNLLTQQIREDQLRHRSQQEA